ncbi:hypothetical protein HZS_4334 [Henneguya salminicola]|nr:hypothetical protein HZS_4334 [Henneguya salminicola]
MNSYRNKNHELYIDNFYNSIKLCEERREVGVYCCGTMRTKGMQTIKKFNEKKEIFICTKKTILIFFCGVIKKGMKSKKYNNKCMRNLILLKITTKTGEVLTNMTKCFTHISTKEK